MILDKVKRLHCTGCSACSFLCPVQALEMCEDKEGFLYPVLHAEKCIHCGLCEKACPVVNSIASLPPEAAMAVQALDSSIRRSSSSGGVFRLLSEQVISRGGVVFGAGFDSSNWRVIHVPARSVEQISRLCGSKYVQSDMRGVIGDVTQSLKDGREVLFSGTPCQVSALKKCLGELFGEDSPELDRLVLLAVACHGVPSPLAWNRYVGEMCDAHGPIQAISFRSKETFGWNSYGMRILFSDGVVYERTHGNDPFLQGFLSELFNRPSCHTCPCRGFQDASDIMLADFWGVESIVSEANDDLGTSLVFLRSDRGRSLFQEISPFVKTWTTSLDVAVSRNLALLKSPQPNRFRWLFFRLCNSVAFSSLVVILCRFSFRFRQLRSAFVWHGRHLLLKMQNKISQ